MRLRRAVMLAVLLLAAVGCGGGGAESQPIETLLYVSGTDVNGLPLQFSLPVDDPACPLPSTTPGVVPTPLSGIQAPNADHQFPGRIFQTRHLFVMEKIHQPVRAVIKNLGSNDLRADLFLGLNPQVSDFVIPPGECKALVSNNQFTLDPMPSGPQIQVEVCSPDIPNGLDTSCTVSPPAPEFTIAYQASVGDVASTSVTNCLLTGLLTACTTPATFFWEQPIDQFFAIMAVNAMQNPGVPVPNAAVRLELYVNGQFEGFQGGKSP